MDMPVYELKVSNDGSNDFVVDYVAGVDKPAIEKDFIAFSEQKDLFNFSTVSEDFSTIFGAAMIPNQLILRTDNNTGEPFKVFYTADTIKQVAESFFENGYQKNFNLMHDPNQKKDGVVFFQSVIKDSKNGIEGLKGDYPDGTWFLGAKVNNDEVKEEIKSGKIKGFSIEGMFKKIQVDKPMYTAEESHRMIENILSCTKLD